MSIITPISRRHICISGFTQSAKRRSGSEKLRLKLHQFTDTETHVSIEDWNTDWESYVSRIIRLGPRDVSVFDIRVYAYSWGGGWGCIELAKYLAMEGVRVKAVVLCDAVYRNPFALHRSIDCLSRLTNWFLGEPKIVVPWNVKNVWWMRQTRDKVHGHQVVATEGSRTQVFQLRDLICDHVSADDNEQYHRTALEVAGRDLD